MFVTFKKTKSKITNSFYGKITVTNGYYCAFIAAQLKAKKKIKIRKRHYIFKKRELEGLN